MRGIPKHLNTKEDYLNFLNMDFVPKKDKIKVLENLKLDLHEWFSTGEAKDGGINDATHKVVESKDPINNKVTYTQMELKVNKCGTLYRLGFTEEEVNSLIEVAMLK
jgi:hypothetical protein